LINRMNSLSGVKITAEPRAGCRWEKLLEGGIQKTCSKRDSRTDDLGGWVQDESRDGFQDDSRSGIYNTRCVHCRFLSLHQSIPILPLLGRHRFDPRRTTKLKLTRGDPIQDDS
jgi:hypothetical protein